MGKQTAGPSTTLRSGWDDNSVGPLTTIRLSVNARDRTPGRCPISAKQLGSYSYGLFLLVKFLGGLTLAEFPDKPLVECREVVRLPASCEVFVCDHLFIDPMTACVANVGADGGPRGEGPFLQASCLDEHPRTVADGADGLARVEEVGYKGYCLGLDTK